MVGEPAAMMSKAQRVILTPPRVNGAPWADISHDFFPSTPQCRSSGVRRLRGEKVEFATRYAHPGYPVVQQSPEYLAGGQPRPRRSSPRCVAETA